MKSLHEIYFFLALAKYLGEMDGAITSREPRSRQMLSIERRLSPTLWPCLETHLSVPLVLLFLSGTLSVSQTFLATFETGDAITAWQVRLTRLIWIQVHVTVLRVE